MVIIGITQMSMESQMEINGMTQILIRTLTIHTRATHALHTSAFFTHTYIMNLLLASKLRIIGTCTCRHSGLVTGSSAITGTEASITEVSVPFD